MTQDQALNLLKTGKNIFLTGPAGSGKTYLLNKYIEYLRKHNIPTAVTASTGIAATHMNGRTIHSWSGIGIKKSFESKDYYKLLNTENIVERVQNAKVLIIDEISMLDASVFELIDNVCRAVRKSEKPFGGLQIVLCGDFFQLPPVQKRDEPKVRFTFESSVWSKSNLIICYLEKQYRQSDVRYLEVLNAIRENTEDKSQIRTILYERHLKPISSDIKPTRLRTHNKDVDAINNFELKNLTTPEKKYLMTERGDQELIPELKRSCLAPSELVLKEGAIVMFVKNNYDGGYVNGTLGKVIGFEENNAYPIIQTITDKKIIAEPATWSVDDEEGNALAAIIQIPLRLAWAITVHKSQGMTLDCAEIDLSKAFVEGMGYVALSRVKGLLDIKLMGINDLALEVSEEISRVDSTLHKLSSDAEKELAQLGFFKLKFMHSQFLLI